MRVLNGFELGSVAGGDGDSCRASDTSESCGARTDGHNACDALSSGVSAVSSIFGNWASDMLADKIQGACYTAVDNWVDAAYRSQINENQQNTSPASFSLPGLSWGGCWG